jgi:hypothetical protein
MPSVAYTLQVLLLFSIFLAFLPVSLVEVKKPTFVFTGHSQFNRIFVSFSDGRLFDVDLPTGSILRSVNTGGALFNSSGIPHHCASGEGFLFTEGQNGLLKYPIPVREMPI